MHVEIISRNEVERIVRGEINKRLDLFLKSYDMKRMSNMMNAQNPLTDETLLSELDFSIRDKRMFQKRGLRTIGELCARDPLDLGRSGNYGIRSIKDLEIRLAIYGRSLARTTFEAGVR